MLILEPGYKSSCLMLCAFIKFALLGATAPSFESRTRPGLFVAANWVFGGIPSNWYEHVESFD